MATTLGVSGAAAIAATAGALVATGTLAAVLTALTGDWGLARDLDVFAGAAEVFFATGAGALDTGVATVFLAPVAAVCFGAVALALAGDAGALTALALLALAEATGFTVLLGLAFLVLVAFNSCLLIETQGPR